ncbi:MAG: glycosyltransferase [Hahellaceae bacterium]|nr:glycosyltransferase [Hahellaceae bacterium]MCP5170131.1 glycosyltransferase [Hahellaceae bacterium]
MEISEKGGNENRQKSAGSCEQAILLNVVILTRTDNDEIYKMTLNAINTLIESMGNEASNTRVTLVESNRELAPDSHAYPSNVKVIIPPEAFNFNRFLNIGAAQCKADYYAFCNNDVVFYKDWFTHIKNVAQSHPEFGSFSPICPVSNRQAMFKEAGQPFVEGYNVTFEISGWAIVIRSSVYESFKVFDEAFSFYFADDDYAMFLMKNGIKHALVIDSCVHHLESGKVSDVAAKPGDTTEVQNEKFFSRYNWIYRSPAMLAGYKHFHKKWCSMYRYAFTRKAFALLCVRLNIRFFSKILFLGMPR